MADVAAKTRAATPTREAGDGAAADPAPNKELDPARFAYISDRTYTSAEVEAATAAVAGAEEAARAARAPNPKMFLRSYWHRAVIAGAVVADEMHVYTLASFFLQLGLVAGGAPPPSAAAAGALSLALELAAGTDAAWPGCLQQASGYAPEEVAALRAGYRGVQASVDAPHLRAVWASRHAAHGYAEFAAEWEAALAVMRAPAGLEEVAAAACGRS
jgi:cyclin A